MVGIMLPQNAADRKTPDPADTDSSPSADDSRAALNCTPKQKPPGCPCFRRLFLSFPPKRHL